MQDPNLIKVLGQANAIESLKLQIRCNAAIAVLPEIISYEFAMAHQKAAQQHNIAPSDDPINLEIDFGRAAELALVAANNLVNKLFTK